MDVVGIGGGSLLVLLIEVPHPLHTHRRSSSYIYKDFQHLAATVASGHKDTTPYSYGHHIHQ